MVYTEAIRYKPYNSFLSAAEICLLDVLALHKLLARTGKNDLSGFKNIGSVGYCKALTSILLNKEDRRSVIVDVLDDGRAVDGTFAPAR